MDSEMSSTTASKTHTVVVEGRINMNFEEDESSDDDDDDEINSNLSGDDKEPITFSFEPLNDDDEEELETFVAIPTSGGGPLTVEESSKSEQFLSEHIQDRESMKNEEPTKSSQKKKEKRPMSLVDIMAASVNAVEEGRELPAPPPPIHTFVEDTSGKGDIFGITYKPYKKKAQEYNMPKGPAFEDEAEFERDFKLNSIIVSEDPKAANDDEFDVVEEENWGIGNNGIESSSNSVQQVKIALQRAAQRVAEETVDDEVAKQKLQEELRLDGGEEEDGLQQGDTAAATGGSEKFDVRGAAKEAFSEIANIYGSGLGDMEIRLLDESEQQLSGSMGAGGLVPKIPLTGTSTIEECDEEELERLEEEETNREKSKQMQLHQQQSELEAEWNSVEGQSGPGARGPGGTRVSVPVPEAAAQWSHAEAFEYLRTIDLEPFSSIVVVREYRSGWMGSLTAPSELKFEGSEAMLRWPFLLAQVDYDGQAVPQHLNILNGLYQTLAPLALAKGRKAKTKGPGSDVGAGSLPCPPIGPHWDNIGFQGLDPRTDVNRSMKMLALLQASHLVHAEPLLARKLFLLSRYDGAVQTVKSGRALDLTWPFMCVSIGFTREALQTLREGSLNKKCNKRKEVLSVLHEFHHACFADFGRRCAEKPDVHHAYHLADLRKEVESSPLNLLKKFRKFRGGGDLGTTFDIKATSRSSSSSSKGSGDAEDSAKAFDSIEGIEDASAKAGGDTGTSESGSRNWITGGKAAKFKI